MERIKDDYKQTECHCHVVILLAVVCLFSIPERLHAIWSSLCSIAGYDRNVYTLRCDFYSSNNPIDSIHRCLYNLNTAHPRTTN